MNRSPLDDVKRLVIVGTGGLGREFHALVENINAAGTDLWQMVGWLDSDAAQHGSAVHDLPVLGDLPWLSDHPEVYVAVGLGAPHTRRQVVEQIRALGHTRFATLIHPSAVIGRRVEIGEGTVICAHVTTTTDYRIGRHVLINLMATVAHDDVLHDYVNIAPAVVISGDVTIGEGTDVGTNATINQGLEIGAWSVVGSGSVVTRSLPANCTAVGAPAKPIKEREAGWHL
ncbi:sugar O-acyltransferase, sialic acid O-acetyltransferase NeuD family [Deinococcus reticulitermitis]|uniref:Sugar O-acyltransferase, sialic acid O-acetyltransferase NeuD family n=1 Tax=Deinococcus reticulitermitis TaxID=856736 RepID=A0A1H6WFJ5_9DEIO|nr:acetyltransferase [Deinococcus reticulitermitis]SEJ12867.1 sugar O-acyltransferase, sialic acid O-acetyltransferase NeuD family [Deinococcus reticulitermitis]